MRHLIDLFDLTREETLELLDATGRLKRQAQKAQRKLPLAGKVLGLMFEKPSLRTRVSFQSAVAQLGGASVFLSGAEVGLGTREVIPDVARTLSQYVDGVVLRVFAHATVETFVTHSSVPVINGLSDYYHPCQALADLFTFREAIGDLKKRTLVFIGDGNNVARSLAVACAQLGVHFILSAPKGYGFDAPFLERLQHAFPKARVDDETVPAVAVTNADVIYTDVWASMGQEAEREHRGQVFADYQVNAALLSHAPTHAVVMHCLPAHRGEEITADVFDSPRSIVFPQAGNRLHLQKALLCWLMDQKKKPSPKKPKRSK